MEHLLCSRGAKRLEMSKIALCSTHKKAAAAASAVVVEAEVREAFRMGRRAMKSALSRICLAQTMPAARDFGESCVGARWKKSWR
jgi:hypothetical protein